MELLCVVILENMVMVEVVVFLCDVMFKCLVKGVMVDYFVDEGCYLVFWINFVKLYWLEIDEFVWFVFGEGLLCFLCEYLSVDL